MKNDLIFFTFIFFISIVGCKNERTYIYPLEKRIEIQRICRNIQARGSNRFMVLLGKIYPLNNDGVTVYIKNLTTSLEDAGYFCRSSQFKKDYCGNSELINIFKMNCNL